MSPYTRRATWPDHDNDFVIRCEGLDVGRVYLTRLPDGDRFVWSIYINGHVPQVPGVPISGSAVELEQAAAAFDFPSDQGALKIKKGDIIEYLHYLAEGSFEVRVGGKTYTANQDLFEHVAEVPVGDVEDNWVFLKCANGTRAYIFLGDLKITGQNGAERWVAGVNEAGPAVIKYGEARDLTPSEAQRLEGNSGATRPFP